ncbi:MAG: sugar phosphate isomerase/epimerase family protein [Candidatus Cyclobacteriaceae bacterium M3_2C_046]
MKSQNRRKFLADSSKAGISLILLSQFGCTAKSDEQAVQDLEQANNLFFDISLAEWSVRDLIRGGEISNLEFPALAKNEFGINAVEYVSQFFKPGQESDSNYLKDLKDRTDSENVKNVLIMVDMNQEEGSLASPDEHTRIEAAQNHHKWVDAAKFLGCHAIRVNARGYEGASYQDAKYYFADGLSRLVEYSKQNEISVVVENHGGISSNGRWLAEVMQQVDDEYCGTLPDFGNFQIDREQGIFYDPLVGLEQLMPYAKGVSAKSNNFDADGNETTMNYPKMLSIVKTAGFNGYVGVEWGGGLSKLSPRQGIMATKNLLIRLGNEMSGQS